MKDRPSEANTAAITSSVTENAAGAHLVRGEDCAKFLLEMHVSDAIKHRASAANTYMFIHVLGQVRDVQVGVGLVGKLLELRVERFLGGCQLE